MSAPTELLHKLKIQSGQKLWLINVPRHLAEEIAAGAEVEIVHETDPRDGVLVFFDSMTEVVALAERVVAGLESTDLLWAAHRRGPAGCAAGLTPDDGWGPLIERGWSPSAWISIDDEWCGVQFTAG